MMHFAIPIIAFDCNFNRYTTDSDAFYFESAEELVLRLTQIFDKPDNSDAELTDGMGAKMANIARTRYVWSKVGERYLDLLKVRVVD
jgi:glycosyltransferase involved in cell wall biosynthesis